MNPLLVALLTLPLISQASGEQAVLRLVGGQGVVMVGGDSISVSGAPQTVPIPVEPVRVIYHPAFRPGPWMPGPVAQILTPAPGETLTIDLDHPFRVWLVSQPPGAEVRLRGKPLGRTPLQITLLLPPPEPVELQLEDYMDMTVPLGPELADSTLTVALEPASGAPTRIETPPKRGPGLLELGSLGLSAVAFGAGFLFKESADRDFDRYLETANLDRALEFFDSAESKDDRARISWVVGQVSLGLAIYLIVKELASEELEQGPVEVQLGPAQAHLRLRLPGP